MVSTDSQSPLGPAALDARAGVAEGKVERLAVLRRLLRHRKGAVGTAVLLVLCLMGLFGQQLAPYDPNEIHIESQLTPPSPAYVLGTDELGRDVLSRILFGARPSMAAGLLTVAVAATLGTLIGLAAGYLSSWFDSLVMSVMDTLLSFPSIFLAIGIVTVLGPGWINAVLAIVIVFTPSFARLVRSATLAVAARDFVLAARAIGCSPTQIMLRHIFPNCVAPLIVLMAVAAPEAILVEGRTELPRTREPAAGRLVGQHAEWRPGLPVAVAHQRTLPRSRHHDRRVRHELLRRRPSGRHRPRPYTLRHQSVAGSLSL